jgi:two-component system, OmpR family, sensor histidine kinase QseC
LKTRSIRAVLLGGSIVVLLTVLGAAAWIGYDGSEEEAGELFDARLATSARIFAALFAAQPPGAGGSPIVLVYPGPTEEAGHDQPGPLGHMYETKIAFQVLDPGGRVLMRSASAPATPYAPLEPGFSTQTHWRVFTLRAGEVWVQAAERDDVRGELSEKLALAAVTPLIAGIPLLLLLIALLMRYGLAPLAELAQRIERRQPGTLGRIELSRSPSEIVPVVRALNGLLERERRFTADAAHELRTPLSALKVHAQNAARAQSDDERRASLEHMLAGLERSIRLAEQMLSLSRASARAGAPEPVSLRQALEDAIEDVLPALKQRGMKISFAAQPVVNDFVVRGDRDKLTTLARNLLDNAVRYSPRGSSVRAELTSRDGGVTLAVSDEGSGIAPELRERVFESYYRVPGSEAEGSGLGLAIVREIATQHGATVEIRDGDAGRGTRVVVMFPASA